MRARTPIVLSLALLLISCTADTRVADDPEAVTTDPGVLTPRDSVKTHPDFGSYWYQGLAELSRYELEQSRYGEIHKGEAVLIFVTEDFLTDKQVKYEGYGPRDNAVSVLKLNAYRRFYTGLYPYTLMTSSFTPTRGGDSKPLKVTTTNQEWCGSTFAQANLRGSSYELHGRSYFQNEGDWSSTIDATWLEDGLWAQVRRDPGKLPTGELSIVPGSHYTRLVHKPYEAVAATATLSDVKTDAAWSDAPIRVYSVEYPAHRRTLNIVFEEAFPHVIVGWEETGPGLGPSMTTRAKLTHAMLEDYWSHHNNADAPLRKSLGLEH